MPPVPGKTEANAKKDNLFPALSVTATALEIAVDLREVFIRSRALCILSILRAATSTDPSQRLKA